jgi:hypothetical protein
MERKLLALLANLPESGISLVSKSNLNETPLNRYSAIQLKRTMKKGDF